MVISYYILYILLNHDQSLNFSDFLVLFNLLYLDLYHRSKTWRHMQSEWYMWLCHITDMYKRHMRVQAWIPTSGMCRSGRLLAESVYLRILLELICSVVRYHMYNVYNLYIESWTQHSINTTTGYNYAKNPYGMNDLEYTCICTTTPHIRLTVDQFASELCCDYMNVSTLHYFNEIYIIVLSYE
jgi:hypothetical protein